MGHLSGLSGRLYLQAALAVVSMASILSTKVLNLGDNMTLTFIASACFVLIAFVGGALRTWFGRIILAGLVCCFIADLTGPGDFLLGLYFFLVAHLFFMGAFGLRGLNARYAWISLAISLLVTIAIMAYFFPHIEPGERIAIIAYAAVIGLMLAFAGGTFGYDSERMGPVILAGAILFYISDIVVAAWHIVGGDFPYAYVCYPLYYLACILLAFTAGEQPHRQEWRRE